VRTVVDGVEEIARAELAEERVEVTRVPVGREVAVAPDVRTEGDVLIVPVLEEVLVVEKRLVLKEELHLRRHVSKENVEVPVTLRKERAVVERVAIDGHTHAEE
jgi:stress response protein YsnF